MNTLVLYEEKNVKKVKVIVMVCLLFCISLWGCREKIEESQETIVFAGMKDIYSIRGESIDYRQGIGAVDSLGQNRSEEIAVDASAVILDECGTYPLRYWIENEKGERFEAVVQVHIVEGNKAVELVLEREQASFVRIESYEEGKESLLGSGFLVDRNEDQLWILTAAHVVDTGAVAEVFFFEGTGVQAEVAARQEEQDLALLTVQTEGLEEELLLQLQPVDMDREYWEAMGEESKPVLGYRCLNPDGTLWIQKTGSLLEKETVFWGMEIPVLRYSIENEAGVSGAAVLDERGKLIAMALGYTVEETGVSNWGIGLPILKDFYEGYKKGE